MRININTQNSSHIDSLIKTFLAVCSWWWKSPLCLRYPSVIVPTAASFLSCLENCQEMMYWSGNKIHHINSNWENCVENNNVVRCYIVMQVLPDCFHSLLFYHSVNLYLLLSFFSRVTSIEMVTSLARSEHGRQYLAQQGIMDKFSNMIRGADTDPFSSLYLPGESQEVSL